jgi:hypothetical protein
MRKHRNFHAWQRAIRSYGIDCGDGFAEPHDSGEPSRCAESLGFGEPYADGHQDGATGEAGTEEDGAGCSRAAETFDERTCRRSDTGEAGGLLSAQQRGDVL